MGSSNSTSIHILWDRINCTEQNSEIMGYNITYYPSRHTGGSYRKSNYIVGTSEINRQYTATQLTPLTQYTFVVTAVSSYNGHSFSLNATTMYVTNRTSGKSFTTNYSTVFIDSYYMHKYYSRGYLFSGWRSLCK